MTLKIQLLSQMLQLNFPHIKSAIHAERDQNQFVYRANRLTEDRVMMALHSLYSVGIEQQLPSFSIKEEEVERVESFRFLGMQMLTDLTWSNSISCQLGKDQQRLYYLKTLKQEQLPHHLLVKFYMATTESILTYSCAVWFTSCTAVDRNNLQRVGSRKK